MAAITIYYEEQVCITEAFGVNFGVQVMSLEQPVEPKMCKRHHFFSEAVKKGISDLFHCLFLLQLPRILICNHIVAEWTHQSVSSVGSLYFKIHIVNVARSL